MIFLDLLLAFFVALAFSFLLSLAIRRTTPGTTGAWSVALLIPFLIIFLAVWAGGVWFSPLGADLWGLRGIAFLLVGLIVALILAAVVPRRSPRTRWEATAQAEEQQFAAWTFSIFFWLLLVVLAGLIIARYMPA